MVQKKIGVVSMQFVITNNTVINLTDKLLLEMLG